MKWRRDPGAKLRVLAMIRKYLDEEVEPHLKSKRDKMLIGSHAKLLAIEREMRIYCRVDPAIFNANPWLFNTPNQTFDLHYTGEPFRGRPPSWADRIDKEARVDPGGDCKQWLTFIEFVSNGDRELALYLQKLAGYALVGVRSEQMFAFLYGAGSNGKSVFLQTLAYVLGDYAVTVDSDVFMWSALPRHKEELMPIQGARLVVASELPPEAKWNEARVKAVTGGERVRARGMGQNSVEFPVEALLIMAGNDRPHMKAADEAMRRRIHLVPFTATVSDEMRDKAIGERFKGEAGGILEWMMQGCALWQRDGLDRPPVVSSATDQYIKDEDSIRQWMDDETVADPQARTATSDLFKSWKQWAEAANIKPGNRNQFAARLAKMGFEIRHTMKGSVLAGLALRDMLSQ